MSPRQLRLGPVALGVVLTVVAAWATLGLLAGTAGLVRALGEPARLLSEQPLALAASSLLAGVVAVIAAANLRPSAPESALIVAGLVGFNLFGAFVIAPLLANELDLETGPVVFIVITGLGAHLAAGAIGTVTGSRLSSRRR